MSVPATKGRVRVAVAREVAAARTRGVDVSPASVTVCYLLADALDRIERDGDDRYLTPQLVARLLEERRAANLLPEHREGTDDVWAQFTADLATLGDAPPP